MLNESLSRLIASDPRRAMDEALKTILDKTTGHDAGLFLATSATELLAGQLDQAVIDRVQAAWSERADLLREGRPLAGGTSFVWPLDSTQYGTPLVYIGAHHVLKVQLVRLAVAQESEILITAIQHHKAEYALTKAEAAAIDRYLASVPMEVVDKRQLEAHLVRHEWNISRVASFLGKSRTTLYQLLERHSIPRQKIRKSPPRSHA